MINKAEEQLMIHALGIKQKDLNKKRIKPYRNYFFTGSRTDDIWENLCKKNLAIKKDLQQDDIIYFITNKGLSELSAEIGTYIYSASSGCVGDAKTPVFEAIVDNDLSTSDLWTPITSKMISKRTRIPLSLVRETVKYLCENEMIVKDYVGGIDEDGHIYCFHGYTTAAKGVETSYFQDSFSKIIASKRNN